MLVNDSSGLTQELTGEVASLERLFEAGQTDLTRVQQARQRLIQLENAQLDALWAATQAQADLMLALGVPSMIQALLQTAEADAGVAPAPRPAGVEPPDAADPLPVLADHARSRDPMRRSVGTDQDRVDPLVGRLSGLVGEVVGGFGVLDLEPVGVAQEPVNRPGGGGDPVDAVGPEVVVAGRGEDQDVPRCQAPDQLGEVEWDRPSRPR